jgi:beta-lactam-binding protein with PASTA domain
VGAGGVADHVHHAPQPPPPRAGAGSMLLAQPGTGQYEPQDGLPRGDRPGWQRGLLWALAILLVAGVAVLAAALLTQSAKPVAVPKVTGLSEQAAGAALRKAGLSPLPSLAASANVHSGLVISQTPAAGTAASKGSRVSIVVSEGPANVPLMDVTGLTAANAEAQLRKAHFKTKTKTEASKSVQAGRVIATEPPAETEVQEGRVITLLVSSGPAPVHVPDLTGELLEAAEATLANDELGVGSVTKRVSGSQAPGTVLAQSPSTGSPVSAGTKVDLTVAKAPKEVEVPNVEGATEVAAEAALKHAGLKSTVQTRPTTEQAQVGIVLEQSPAGATQARKGATVTLVVGMLSTTTTTPTTTTTTTTTTATTPPPAAPVE